MRLARGLLAVAYPFAVFGFLRWLEPRWDPRALLLVPVFINLGLLFAFGRTLRGGPTIVERLARLREPALSAAQVRHCRTTTAGVVRVLRRERRGLRRARVGRAALALDALHGIHLLSPDGAPVRRGVAGAVVALPSPRGRVGRSAAAALLPGRAGRVSERASDRLVARRRARLDARPAHHGRLLPLVRAAALARARARDRRLLLPDRPRAAARVARLPAPRGVRARGRARARPRAEHLDELPALPRVRALHLRPARALVRARARSRASR